MSVAGLLIISIQGLTDLPESVHSAVVGVRVLSRRERRVPRSPETVTTVAKVENGLAVFETDDPHIEVYAPFPREDVVRVNVSTALHEEAFGTAPLIRVAVLEKSRRIERTFTLSNPKNKENCGTLKLVINYVPPTIEIPEDIIAQKLRDTVAPGKTMTFQQALAVLQDVNQLSETAKAQAQAQAQTQAQEQPQADSDGAKKDEPEKGEDAAEKPGESASEKSDDKNNSKKHSSHHSHRSKDKVEKSSSASKISKSNSSSSSAGSGGSSKRSSVPPISTDELSKAMTTENEGGLTVIAHAAGVSGDIMLGPTPRRERESLRHAVEARPRGGSGSGKSGDKLPKPSSKNVVSTTASITVTPCEKLSFGLQSRQASLETDLLQTVTLENKSPKQMCFRFLLKNTEHPKYSIYAEPENGKLKPGQKMEVVLKLVIHCTTNLRLSLPMVMWKGHMKEYETAATETLNITAGVQSKLSTKLDSEEVEIFRPPIGSGAFGTVYRGKYRGFEVAVKVLKDQANCTPELIEAFECEVEMAEALRHTSIVNFVGAVHFKNQLAIVTEFCPFGDLNSALKKYPFPYPLKLKALLDASRAMDYLHQSGMIHRDLKTENLLVVSLEAMSQTVCKLSDFGTARGLNSFAQAKTMMLTKGVGTPIFMAPEILAGSQNYAEAADVYSFGVMMCHVANNELPYTRDRRFDSSYQFVQKVIGGMRPELKVEVPADYQKLMTSCWDQNPDSRPPFSEVSDMLEDMFFAARSSLPSASILQN